MKYFVAFGSKDKTHAETIAAASKGASSADVTYAPWSAEDRSGSPVHAAVEDWLDDAEGIACMITYNG
jgi:hypothetical protein